MDWMDREVEDEGFIGKRFSMRAGGPLRGTGRLLTIPQKRGDAKGNIVTNPRTSGRPKLPKHTRFGRRRMRFASKIPRWKNL
jgi:hypothetical protein